MKRRILTVFLTLAMSLTIILPISAQETSEQSIDNEIGTNFNEKENVEVGIEKEVDGGAKDSTDKTGFFLEDSAQSYKNSVQSEFNFDVTQIDAVDLSAIENLEIFPKANNLTRNRSVSSEISEELSITSDEKVNSEIHIDDQTQFSQKNNSKSRSAKSSYVGYEVSDTLTFEGQEYAVYPIWLSPGQALQAQLTIPSNLSIDYNLLLCQFDMSTGNLNPNAIDASTMPTTNAFTPEAVGAINTSGSDVAYAIFIVSNVGANAPFKLNITISGAGTYDAGETNENIYASVSMPSLNEGGQYFSFNASLNTPYDNDWFVLHVPNLNSYSTITLETEENLNIELYAVNNSGQPYRKSSHNSSGDYDVVAGYNYFRVSNNGSQAVGNYNLKFTAKLGVDYYTFDYVVDNEDCIRSSNNFPDYNERLLLLTARNFEWRVTYYNSAGYPVSGVYNPLKIHYWNPSWGIYNENPGVSNDHGNRIRISDELSDSNGVARVVVPCGSIRNPNSSGMGWDQVKIFFEMPDTGFQTETQMALVPKYNDGEKTKPCYRHGISGHSM